MQSLECHPDLVEADFLPPALSTALAEILDIANPPGVQFSLGRTPTINFLPLDIPSILKLVFVILQFPMSMAENDFGINSTKKF